MPPWGQVVDVIDEFLEVTDNMASPHIFRLWSAITMVSATMSRRIYTCIEDDLKLFPNIYVMMVSQPGIGKSRPLEVVSSLLSELETTAFSGDEVTREEMVQHLGEVFMDTQPEGKRSFLLMISELATFMPKADLAWMQAIARIWDCPRVYTRRTKHMGHDNVHNPYVCMLAGAQPAWFSEGFPQNAYELGLPARIFFIYADKKPNRKFFRRGKQLANLAGIRASLQRITQMEGEALWTPEAVKAWGEWVDGGMTPVTMDPLLTGYNTRRDMHLGKLSLISAAAAHPGDLTIKLADLKRAMTWMFEAEARMPTALQSAGGNVYRLREEAIVVLVAARYAADKKPIPEYVVRRELGKMVPPTVVGQIVDELVSQRRLRAIGNVPGPNRQLLPGEKK